jgi:LysR family transcriptional regulator, hydrogen peroxide-inducible genes activator
MNLRDLTYLLALAESKNFSRAAKMCFVSQPTLSTQIQKLEDELQCQLFERHRQHIMITEAGKVAVAYAHSIQTQLQDMKNYFKELKQQQSIIQLGMFPTLAPYLLPHFIPLIKKKMPQLRVFLHELKTEDCIKKLDKGELDLIFVAEEIPLSNICTQALWKEDFYLATSAQHNLRLKKSIQPQHIPVEELILLQEGHCLSEQSLSYCHKINKSPQHNYQAASLETLISMVELGEGVTFIPEISIPYLKHYKIDIHPIKKPPQRSIYMAWRESNKQQQLRQHIAEIAKKAAAK